MTTRRACTPQTLLRARPAVLVLICYLIGSLAACKPPEDHRADTTVGPTPVGTAGIVGVPIRPTRAPRANIPFWTEEQALAAASKVELSPLPGDARVMEFGRTGLTVRFFPERESGLTWICPNVEKLLGGSDAEQLLGFVRSRFESAGYQTVNAPRLTSREYRAFEAYTGISSDRSHEVIVLLSDGDTESGDPPYVFRLTWEQRCNG